MDSIKVLTVNCQGLGDISKRKDVFDYLKSKQCDIYCIQDTHFTCDIENHVRNSWGYESFFSSFASNSRGVALLFNNTFEFKVLKEKKDLNGNYLVLDICIGKEKITLVTVYGPNSDTPDFFSQLMSNIEDFGNENFIICGDFNLVLDPHIDCCNYRNINNPNAREKLLDIIDQYRLIDPFRELFPTLHRYTWRRKNPFKQARLDFFLFTESMLTYLRNCKIEPSYRSDHSMVILELVFNPFIRGKGLWKFNNSLLSDIDYVNIVKDKILDVKRQYSALVYDLNNIGDIEDENLQLTINKQLFLETLLMELRGKTISYSSFKKKERDKREQVLLDEIDLLECSVNNESIEDLENKKKELENIRKDKMKGKLVRSRVQWIEEGEKPTKYFCGLESKNFTSKIIPKVEKEGGIIVTNQFDILKEAKSFYENLYKNNNSTCTVDDLNHSLNNLDFSKLTDDEKLNLEGEITIEEASWALKKMKNNKTPGSDGFSTEFFKIFWRDLKHFVVDSLNYGLQEGELSVTQKQGIITCLPKDNKPRHFLKNWRPISLLNTVYKIGSGVIASRVKKVLDKLINLDQTGFISGRYIGDNIRLVYDILQYTEEQDIPGLLLLIDFEKAFDSISWDFLLSVLQFFNFGESFIKWVKVLYTNISSAVIQGGNLSDFFKIERGCRQGDPLSPYLFILCAEILAIKIRGNKNISGISITQIEHKLSQFADDTSLILDGSEKSLQETLLELDWYADISGLKINFSKTHVVWIGSKKYSNDVLCHDRNLSWGTTKFKLLGVNFDVNLENMVDCNYRDKLSQIKNLINTWSKRNLTLIGRISVVKTLILPILNHLIMTLPNPNDEMVKKIDNLIYSFIWNSPVHRVKKEVLQKSHIDGGLKMINLSAFILALKSTWIRKIFRQNCNWLNILFASSNLDQENFFNFGTGYINSQNINFSNKFWQDVFNAWEIITDKEKDNSWDFFLCNPIWFNKLVKIDNKSVFYSDWFKKGIVYINDVLDENGKFLSFEDIKQKFGVSGNVMKYNSIISAVRKAGKQFIHGDYKIQQPFVPSIIRTLLKNARGTHDMYSILIKNDVIPTGQKKWSNIIDIEETQWREIFSLPFKLTRNTKLQWLQFRINHYILVTNKYLKKINVVDDPNCTFCKDEVETIEHLLWNCDITQNFLEEIDHWLLSNGISIPFTKKHFYIWQHSKVFQLGSLKSYFIMHQTVYI